MVEIARLVVYTVVCKIEKRGAGYWMHLDGSRESLYIGDEEPFFKEGDRVKVSFERMPADERE